MPDEIARKARKRSPKRRPLDAASLSATIDRSIADQLRAVYDAVTAEPIPDRLLELLDRLDQDGEK